MWAIGLINGLAIKAPPSDGSNGCTPKGRFYWRPQRRPFNLNVNPDRITINIPRRIPTIYGLRLCARKPQNILKMDYRVTE